MRIYRLLTGILMIFLLTVGALPQSRDMSGLFDANTLRAHIKFLSDDMMEGRAPGSRGGDSKP